MDNKCSKCGGALINSRLSTGAHFLGIIPIEDEKKFKPRYTNVLCDVCIECGNIENIHAENPIQLR